MSGRKPDYLFKGLVVNETRDNHGNTIGVAWLNDDGSISVKLKPFTILDGNKDNILLTLFPNDGYEAQMRKGK